MLEFLIIMGKKCKKINKKKYIQKKQKRLKKKQKTLPVWGRTWILEHT